MLVSMSFGPAALGIAVNRYIHVFGFVLVSLVLVWHLVEVLSISLNALS